MIVEVGRRGSTLVDYVAMIEDFVQKEDRQAEQADVGWSTDRRRLKLE